MPRIIVFFVVFCWLVACRLKDHAENKSKLPLTSSKQLGLRKAARIDIRLPHDLAIDDETQVHFSIGDSTLYIYNQFNNHLIAYSFPKQKFEEPVSISEKLPSGFKATGMTFYNKDTIALYSYSKKQLCLFNLNGNIFKTFTFSIPRNIGTSGIWNPSPTVSNNVPASFGNGRIYLTGYISGESESEKFDERLVTSVLSLHDDKVHFTTPYTAIYEDRNYGGFYFRIPYTTTNYLKNIALVSLPASHDIVLLNLFNNTSKFINLSPPFEIDIPAIEESKKQLRTKETLAAEHYSTNYSYKNIIYHPYKDVYIRILENPIPEQNLNSDKLGYKSCTALLYDADFRFIGQHQLDRYLSTDNFFITPGGICFLKGDNHDENLCQYVSYKFN